jgi:hypothetical protein
MYTVVSSRETASAIGPSRVAVDAAPSVLPSAPVPATVVTAFVDVESAKTLLLYRSAMKSVPSSAVRARPMGYEKAAAVPMPSLLPVTPEPATVVTAAVATVIRRIL